MSILKKITNKYGSLRFLNKKATKLGILSAALVGLCLSSGYSFAKYRDENYAGGNAGIAIPGDFIIDNQPFNVQMPESFEDCVNQVHAFETDFSVKYFGFEVKTQYTVMLRLAPENEEKFEYNKDLYSPLHTSFYITDNSYINNSNNFQIRTFDNSVQTTYDIGEKTNNTKELSTNTCYSAKGKSSANLSWSDTAPHSYIIHDEINDKEININNILVVDQGIIEPGKELNMFYKLIFFVTPYFDESETELVFEPSNLLYKIDFVQLQ